MFGTKFADTITGANTQPRPSSARVGTTTSSAMAATTTLFGDAGLDDLYGGEGNDRLSPEGDVVEADHLFGGDGSDWVDYSNAGAARTGQPPQRCQRRQGDGRHLRRASRMSRARTSGTRSGRAALNGRAYGGGGRRLHLRC